MPEKMLELVDYHFYYGQIHAIKGISLHVDKGEIVSLIGGNGAGKTTTLRSISGLLGKGGSGEIRFMGQNQKINQDGMTILLVEQNSNAALQIAHRGYVMETGSIVLEGSAEELRSNGEIQKSYLGQE